MTRIPYLALYNVAVAGVCAASIGFALQAHDRASRASHWNGDANRVAKVGEALQHRDELAVARYQALTQRYNDVGKKIQAAEKTLAAEIARTRTLHAKVITGATLVSYVTVPGGTAPTG
jgi:hypothetical protein